MYKFVCYKIAQQTKLPPKDLLKVNYIYRFLKVERKHYPEYA